MEKPVENPIRLKPLSPDILNEKYKDCLDALPGEALKGENAPFNVFGVLFQRPEVTQLFFPYWAESKKLLNISIYEQELIILRMAVLFRCEYVWGHHVPVMQAEGIDDETIYAIALFPKDIS